MFRNVRFFCSKTFKPPNDAESVTILKILNTSTEEELAKFKVSQPRAAKIVQWRSENGLFNNCEDLLELKGIGGPIAVNKLYESIISPVPEKKSKEPKVDTLTVPDTFNEISKITSCSSIRVGITNISWASFEFCPENQNIEVTHLENYTFNEKKIHIGELVNKVWKASKHIPETDCYIFENPKIATPGSPGNAEQVNINVQQSQVLAMLSLIFRQRNTTSFENVFYLKRYIYARLFKLLVGTEIVSTKSVVDDILEQGNGSLKLDYEIRSKYQNLEPFEQEFLRQTLLMGLAFIKLSVFKCPKSLECLKRKD